jgi:hypothetical protein
MTVTVEDLRAYVGAVADDEFLQPALDTAEALIEQAIGTVETVPAVIQDQAVLVTASEIFHRRGAPFGVQQFGLMDGAAPQRVSLDPKTPAWRLLQPFIGYAV